MFHIGSNEWWWSTLSSITTWCIHWTRDAFLCIRSDIRTWTYASSFCCLSWSKGIETFFFFFFGWEIFQHFNYFFLFKKKPANILLDEHGHVRISDLGLACDFSKKKPHASVYVYIIKLIDPIRSIRFVYKSLKF